MMNFSMTFNADLRRLYLVKKAHKELATTIEIEGITHRAIWPFKSTVAAALVVEVNIFIMLELCIVHYCMFCSSRKLILLQIPTSLS